MIGGTWFDEVLGSNPSLSDVEDIAIRSISKQLGVSEQPVNIHSNILMVRLWDRAWTKSVFYIITIILKCHNIIPKQT